MKIKIEVQVRDPGKKGKGGRWHESHSLVKNFIILLFIQMSQTATLIRDTANVLISELAQAAHFTVVAAAGITAQGIVIGTNGDPVTMDDYKLGAQMTVNMAHGLQAYAVDSPNPSTYRITLTRGFTNNTGAVVQIKELGIYSDLGASANPVMYERTNYGLTFPIGGSKIITYRFSIML